MLAQLLRIVVGFALACLASGATMVLFVTTPAELLSVPPDVAADRLANAGVLAAAVATQVAIFSAPFALVGLGIGEWWRAREWPYYALLGLVVAVIGFMAQYNAEAPGQPSIVNNYALTAFLTAGFVGGLLYWIVAGRYAGLSSPAQGWSEAGERPAAPDRTIPAHNA